MKKISSSALVVDKGLIISITIMGSTFIPGLASVFSAPIEIALSCRALTLSLVTTITIKTVGLFALK